MSDVTDTETPRGDNDMTTTTYRCINDRYDNDPNNTYESVEDFQRMLLACFGEPATLTLQGDNYCDETGSVVLEPVEAEPTTEAKLQAIADALNTESDRMDNLQRRGFHPRCRYSHWDHFVALCDEHDLTADASTQDKEDIECSYTLYAEEGTVVLRGDRWAAGVVIEETEGVEEDEETQSKSEDTAPLLYSFDLSDYEAGEFTATRYPANCAVGGDHVLFAFSDEDALAQAMDAAENEWAAPATRHHHDFTVKFVSAGATEPVKHAFTLYYDQGVTEEIQATDYADAREQAEDLARDSDWEPVSKTWWCKVGYQRNGLDSDGDEHEYRTVKVAIEPIEPECEDGEDHVWLDGDVRGSGGGVQGTDLCTRCGLRKHWDTWATDLCDGEQGLDSVCYESNEESDDPDRIGDYLDALDIGDLDQDDVAHGDGWHVFIAHAPKPWPWHAVCVQTESRDRYEPLDVQWYLSLDEAMVDADVARCNLLDK